MTIQDRAWAWAVLICSAFLILVSARDVEETIQHTSQNQGGDSTDAIIEDVRISKDVYELESRLNAITNELTQLKEAINAAAIEVLPAEEIGDSYTNLYKMLVSHNPQHLRASTEPEVKLLPVKGAFPSLYKIKTKPYERTMFDLAVSFDVYAGDTYLGEFRQSYPWVRVFWDEIVFWDKHGHFVGQLHFSLLKYLWYIPNIFYGTRYCWLYTADGNLLMHGAEEPFLTLALRAEQPGIDFQVPGNDRHFKSRMTNTIPPRKWLVVDKDSGDKMATIEESYTTDVFKRHFSGWSVEVPEYTAIDPRVAGFLAAFDLAEEMDTLPSVIRTMGLILLCFLFPYFFFR